MPNQLIVALALAVALIEVGEAFFWRHRLKVERQIVSAIVVVFLKRSTALHPEDVERICKLLDQRRRPIC